MDRRVLLAALALSGAILYSSAAFSAMGRTPGSFTVTPSGSASYTIPIFAPPGPRGMQPNIALTYDSNADVGPVGKGWGISGLAAISRCRKTYAQDSDASPVVLAVTDGYCLNGQRLMRTGGTYGYAGSTYQTEIAEFSQVTAVGAAGNGPASFTVKSKDGLIYEYGNTTDSRVIATGTTTATVWMVNLISDRAGNRVKFTYKTPDAGTTGTTEPVKIEWTATSAGAGTFVYSMDFGYGNNVAASSEAAYVAGTEIKNDDLLTSISVSQSGTVKKKYFLAYDTSPTTGTYRVTSVTECSDSTGTDCLLPTTIAYQNGQSGTATSTTSAISATDGQVLSRYDVNGDGYKDLVYRVGTTIYVKFGSYSGYGSAISTGLSAYIASTLLVGDVRGNGQAGLLSLQGGVWKYYYWNGSSFVMSSTGQSSDGGDLAALADVNGDGLPDLVSLTSSSGLLRYRLNTSTLTTASFSSTLTTGTSFGTAVTFVTSDTYGGPTGPSPAAADFNGDGREDFAFTFSAELCYYVYPYGMVCGGGYQAASYVLIAQSNGTFVATQFEYYQVSTLGEVHTPSFINLNDDECTDLASGTSALISKCNSNPWSATAIAGNVSAALDWNGDGRTDYITATYGSNLQVYLSTGSGFSGPSSTGIAYQACQWQTLDANADGLDDLGCRGGASFPLTYYVHNGPGQAPDLATSFTDGYGVNQTVTYTAATWGNYTKQSNAIAPNVDYAGPMQIVASVVSTDGVGATFTKSYQYYGAAVNREGRGFAGISMRMEVDSRNGVAYVYHHTDFPLIGNVYNMQKYQPGAGYLMFRQDTSLTSLLLDATANSKRYFVYPTSILTRQYEVGGSANGNLISEVSETPTFDGWGNLTASTRVATDKDIYSPQYTQTWTETSSTTISPDYGTNWCLGLPTASSVTYTASNGETSVTRAKSFTPDYTNCRIYQEFVEPNIANRRVATTFGFDGFGNVNSISVVGRNPNGTDMAARTTAINWGTTGQFPVSDTNPLSQTTQRTYNATFGALATQTDPNSIVVANNSYDAFGRLTRNSRADGTSTVYSYVNCSTYSCQNGDPASGVTSINKMIVVASERDTSDTQIRDTLTLLDQFDRPIVTNSRMVSGGYNRTGRQYDALGRVYRETAPCDAASCTAYWVTNAYDLINRVTSQTRPQSQSVSTPVTTTIAYAGRTQTVTDAQGKVTTKILDVAGRMRRSQDHNSYYQLFGYDAAGSLKTVSDSLSNALFSASYTYGIDAFQDSSSDMDLGARTYTYNSLGELTAWTDAKSQSFSMAYDALSRPTSRTEAEGTTTWTWGTTAGSYNIGQLASVSMSGYSEAYTFDNKGRLATKTVAADQSYGIDYAYTNQGLLDTLTFPTSTSSTRVKVKYGYQYGILKSVTDYTTGSAGTVYWTANAQNPRGQTTQESLGNGIVTNRALDAVTGWMASIQAGVGGGAGVQNQSYLYDLVGNVTQRQESNLGLTENFYYDNLYRLSYSQLNSSTNLSLSYDAMGNITSRSDVGGGASWTYDTTKKHAVKTAGSGNSYNYDANGNMSSRNGSTINWTSYNYPSSVAAGSESASFYYNPDRQYYKQVYSGPSGTETTHYIGGVLEKVALPSGTVDWRHYVYAEGQAVAIVSRLSTGSNSVSYPLEDHLGGSSVLTNSSGGSIVKESFTAFGAPRNGSTWSGAVPAGDKSLIAGISRRGYTYHSMLGDMSLIHMNGRVQDAITGRFLSPDPTVPNPGFTQSYNRYAYVNNNPLTYTDPSGFAGQMTGVVNCDNVPMAGVVPDGCLPEVVVTGCDWQCRMRAMFNVSVFGPSNLSYETWNQNHETYSPPPERTTPAGPNVDSGGPQEDKFGVDDAASLGVGFTPAGTIADFCTAVTGEDCITGDKVDGFWRVAGLVPLVSEARKAGHIIDAVLDVTRKVHGPLPHAQDLASYGVEDLARLRNELQTSVQTRIEKTVELGADPGHNARLAEEQQLIKSIDKHLKDR